MSSVLATAFAASLLTFEIARWTKCLIAGIAAGLVLSAETNAIFFGTELRPYAFVILASTIAVLCLMRLLSRDPGGTSNLPWIGLVLVTLFAALCQPTSLGVLGWLFVSLVIVNLAKRRVTPRFSIVNALLATAVLAVGWTLWQDTLASTWRFRSNWASFATAPPWTDSASLWSWGWLWLIPLLLVVAPCGRWLSQDYSSRQRLTIVTIGLACCLATLPTGSHPEWIGCIFGIDDTWSHCCRCSLCLSAQRSEDFEFQISNLKSRSFVVATFLLAGLTSSQGVIKTAIKSPSHLAYRGEDWRGAIGWINQNTNSSDRLFLDSGLIEANLWRTYPYPPGYRPSNTREQYLLLPISGPYENLPFYPVDSSVKSLASNIYVDARFRRERAFDFQVFPSRRRRIVYLSRRPADKQEVKLIKELARDDIDADAIEVHGFGGVSIMVIPLSRDK